MGRRLYFRVPVLLDITLLQADPQKLLELTIHKEVQSQIAAREFAHATAEDDPEDDQEDDQED